MAEDVIIARFEADVEQLKAELKEVTAAVGKLDKAEKEHVKTAQTSSVQLADAAKRRVTALRAEEAELKRLQASLKAAFTAPQIAKLNADIAKTKSNISLLKGEVTGLGKVTQGLGSQFAGIGAGVAAAFSVQAVIAFGKASIDAFLDAEENAARLKNALREVGEEGESAFKSLIKQSEELAQTGKTIFTDDDIQRAQAQLANFGLTAIEIEKLIPKLADYASATKQNIVDASAKVGQALQGQGREFKKYGVFVDASSTSTENLNKIMDGLTQFQGQAAKATETLTGQLADQQRQVEELQESIGEGLAPAYVKIKLAALGFIQSIVEVFSVSSQVQDTLKDLGVSAQNASRIIAAAGNDIDGSKSGVEAIRNYEKLAESIEFYNKNLIESKNPQLDYIKSVQRINELITEQNTQTKEGQTSIKILKTGLEDLNKTYSQLSPSLEKFVDLSKKTTEELTKLLETSADDRDLTILINRELKKRSEAEKTSKAAIEAARKQQQELNKLADEDIKNQESLRQQQVKSAVDAINKEAEARKLALSEQNITEQEFADKRKQIELDTLKDLIAINELSFDERAALLSKLNDLQADINRDGITAQQKADKEIFDRLVKEAEEAGKKQTEDYKAEIEKRKALNEELKETSIRVAGELADAIFTIERNNIQRQQEAEFTALDEEKERALSNKRLTSTEIQRINEDFAKKELALKKKQFEQNKKQATAEALIQGALATIEALPNYFLVAAVALTTALEVGVIQSQKFAKGKKANQKGGLSQVGELGPEYMWVPDNAMILSNQKSKKHKGLINSMQDGNEDDYIFQKWVFPAIQKHEQKYKEKKEKSFSDNLAHAIFFNGLTEQGFKRGLKTGTKVSNVDEIVEKLSKAINTSSDIRRRI